MSVPLTTPHYTKIVVLIRPEGQWLDVDVVTQSGLVGLFLQSGKDVMLGNDGDEDAKLVAVHNGVGEVRSDVSTRIPYLCTPLSVAQVVELGTGNG